MHISQNFWTKYKLFLIPFPINGWNELELSDEIIFKKGASIGNFGP